LGLFELDRVALVLNRLMVLGLAVLCTALAVRLFARGDYDPGRVLERLRPWALVKTGLRLLPYAVAPVAAGVALWLNVYQGFQGALGKKAGRDSREAHPATWKGRPLPAPAGCRSGLGAEPRPPLVSGARQLLATEPPQRAHCPDPFDRGAAVGAAHLDPERR